MLMKFHEMIEHSLRTNRLDFERLWPKIKATRDQKVKIIFANNSVQNCRIESRDKN